MSHDLVNVPAVRSWREIPQPVKPRTMSSGGRWRLVMAGVRVVALIGLCAGLAWGVWMIILALQEDPRKIPAAAKSVPVKPPELKTMREGVLDDAWLARTLELPPGASLLELDLDRLRDRVLADPQVITANLEKHFPDRLVVHVTERMPIARLRVEFGGVLRDLLVARDGVVFFGTGFDPVMIRTLPWLDGIVLSRDGAWFEPIPHMDIVARLLAEAQFSAPHLYHYWQSVSLERLALDRELEVTMKDGSTARFTAKGSFFTQLTHLDDIVDRLSHLRGMRARVDLTLGREVPVTVEPLAATEATAPAQSRNPLSPLFPPSQSKTHREL